jgi:YidC/Oxa1 family membrane protein insertase
VAKSKYFLVGLLQPVGGKPFAEAHLEGGVRTRKQATNAFATVVIPLDSGRATFEMYAGPQSWRRLHDLGREFETANPYGGWLQGIVQPFSTIVMRVLLWMKKTIHLSYGWVLVIFGVTVRLLMWPLNQGAMRTSLKMQRIQPELSEVQKKYKSDPQKQQAEIMRVYKEHNMSPFSTFSGCLPMLIPMPVFFALFFVFQNTIEFRGVPFLWLQDISLHDPYYILPIVMGASMLLISWIGMRNAPPNPQAKTMMYMMPIVFVFVLFNTAAGLSIYYLTQNLASLPQQWLISNERAKAKQNGR